MAMPDSIWKANSLRDLGNAYRYPKLEHCQEESARANRRFSSEEL
jgi:hypothetical protein